MWILVPILFGAWVIDLRDGHTETTEDFLEKHHYDLASNCRVKEYNPADDRVTYLCNETMVVLKLSVVIDFQKQLEEDRERRARFFE